MKPRGILCVAAVEEFYVIPIGVVDIESAAKIHHINVEAIKDHFFRLGKLLNHVINAILPTMNAEMFLQTAISDG